jgi:hypothetical protein
MNLKDINTIYNKYLALESSNGQIGNINSLKGQSPFGEGEISINEAGHFNCIATGQKGDVYTFIQRLYPNLSTKGVNRVVSMDSKLSFENIGSPQEAVSTFRKEKRLLKVAAEKANVSADLLEQMPIYMNQRGFRYTYIDEMTPSGNPLTLNYFTNSDVLGQTIGIRRFKGNYTNRVWLVENNLIAAWLTKMIDGETALMWPKASELGDHDFKTMFAGCEVIILHGNLTYCFDDSFYPVYAEIIHTAAKVSIVPYVTLTAGQPLNLWLSVEENLELLFEQASRNTGRPPIDKKLYDSAFKTDYINELKYVQGRAKGYYFYGINDGTMVHSYPLSIMTKADVERKFNVEVKTPDRFMTSTKLDRAAVLSIAETITSLTPPRIFQMIKNLLDDHMYFQDENTTTLISLWIMATYTFQLHDAFPYLHTQGEAGSGKTTLLEMIEATSFNGAMATRITNARLMQEINDTMCTLALDEFEKLTSNQRDSTIIILNSGYKRSGKYLRLKGDDDSSTDLYSPKIYAGIDDISRESLKSRTLSIPLSRKPTHINLRAWSISDANTKDQIKIIQQGGYATGLYHHEYLEYLIARLPRQINLPSGINIDARRRELIAPLVTMAQLIDTGNADTVVENQLMAALESMFYPEKKEDLKKLKMLSNQLKEWGENLEKHNCVLTSDYLIVDNEEWNDTALLQEFEGKSTHIIKWLKAINGNVLRKTHWMPNPKDSKSCLFIPLNFLVNNKEVREWVMP